MSTAVALGALLVGIVLVIGAADVLVDGLLRRRWPPRTVRDQLARQ